MKVVYGRCAGADVHKRNVTVCVITPEGKQIREFGTTTQELRELVSWLLSLGVTHVAMESTGVYWKPLFNVLEASEIEPVVVNAHPIKNVPGRKTDVKDAEWIAEGLRHGLLRPSYIPGREQRELRELVQYRRSLIEERAREAHRVQKLLEGANIKLGDVASDVLGKSGRAMLRAMVQGETDPAKLAELAEGRLRQKKPELQRALYGLMGRHQQWMLRRQLRHIEELEAHIEELDREIAERMRPFDPAIELLRTIPGVERRTAEELLPYIGTEMNRFPTERHLAAWCHVAPGSDESAGKRKSGRTQPGKLFVRNALVRAANSAARTKNTYLSAQYHRIAARRGSKRAKVAVAHTIVVILYHMLESGESYRELGATYFDRLNEEATVRRLTKRIESLGYIVNVTKAA